MALGQEHGTTAPRTGLTEADARVACIGCTCATGGLAERVISGMNLHHAHDQDASNTEFDAILHSMWDGVVELQYLVTKVHSVQDAVTNRHPMTVGDQVARTGPGARGFPAGHVPEA